MNGKGDKQRVRWTKEFEENYNRIFKKEKDVKEDYKHIITLKMKIESRNVLDKQHWAAKRRNKELYRMLVRNQMKLRKVPLAKHNKRYIVEIISCRKRFLDMDNLYGGVKQLLDAMTEEQFIFDDAPKHIQLKVEQIKSKEYETIITRKETDIKVK
tara:strand:+ start:3335 stop:3802 length:468 start_codon:yes stop_codon:yes gene_type:complete